MNSEVDSPDLSTNTVSVESIQNGWVPTRKDAYQSLIGFAQQAEANSWNRFYNFLMFSTLLILAWSTIYSQNSQPPFSRLVLAVIAVVGILSGIAWSGLGYRGRKYVTFFLEEGAKIEKDAVSGIKVCKRAIETRKEIKFSFLGSYWILIVTPFVFSALYTMLLVVSLILPAKNAP